MLAQRLAPSHRRDARYLRHAALHGSRLLICGWYAMGCEPTTVSKARVDAASAVAIRQTASCPSLFVVCCGDFSYVWVQFHRHPRPHGPWTCFWVSKARRMRYGGMGRLYCERARLWGRLGCGALLAAQACGVYVASVLDRFYGNGHLADQLDRDIMAVALGWKPGLSHYRAILFSRRAPLDAAFRSASG